ncbi:hypothetical protein BKM17_23715 [Pseudomonas syringae group genomosp. 3]|nr:hypothetical protein BKM17_23715 [Pseudomonas syringae group genomosp. 3]
MTENASAFVKAISQFSDPYDRQARLAPALLSISPVTVMAVALYGDKLGIVSFIISLLTACGLLFFLSDFARGRGKAKEKALWQKWGGAPSTLVLRHRDNTTFEPGLVENYHAKLSMLMDKHFPSALEELDDPKTADALYASACGMLRDSTRDHKTYGLLFRDNISYGFRRNAFGLRKIAITLCVGSLVWVAIRQGLSIWVTRLQTATNPESFFTLNEVTAIGASLVMLLVWSFYITEASVKEAAFCYAKTLILASETLASKHKASKAKIPKAK